MSELEKMLRRVLDEALTEKLQPINERLDDMDQRMGTLEQGQASIVKRLDTLEKGQRKIQKDVSEVKLQLKGVWGDILRLDNRLINQEK